MFNVATPTPPASAITTYTIATALSPTTFSVSTVDVDGVTLASGDFSVAGQDITITNPALTGGEVITVTLTHQTVVDLLDTYTISQALTVTGYQLESILLMC